MRDANDPRRVQYGDGPSGLRVARQSAPPGAASFSATYVGPAGWGFDAAGSEGTARLSSALVTSGAGRRGRLELARFLDRTGATLTAHVDPESAEVTVWGPADAWKPLLELLADAVLRPRYEDSDLDRVRRQLRERQLRELSQPGSRVERELLLAVFPPGHPYRESGIGSPNSVARATRERIDRFHHAHTTGHGALLTVTGRASLEAVERSARQYFDVLPSGPAPILPSPRLRVPRDREVKVDLPGRSQVEVRIGGPSIPRSDARYAAAFLANEVLGGGALLSRLYKRVRSKGGLAYHASSQLEAMRAGGYWQAQAGTGADRWTKVVPMLREEVARLATDNIPRSELDLMRESRIGQMALSLESTADAHDFAVEVAYHGLPEDHWARWPTELRALTARDVRRAAEVALDGQAAVTVLAGPIGPA